MDLEIMTSPTPNNVRRLHAVGPDEAKYTEFHPDAERQLVYALCTDPKVWALIGEHINPECLQDDRGKMLLLCARAIARETGTGPADTVSIAQHLQSLHVAGKFGVDKIDHAMSLFDDVEDSKEGVAKNPVQLVNEMAKVIRGRASEETIQQILMDQGKGKSLGRHAQRLLDIPKIGVDQSNRSIMLDNAVWGRLAAARGRERLPLGITDLDEPMADGTRSGKLIIIGARTGVGKTAMLIHTGAYNIMRGMRVIHISLEMETDEIEERYIAALTGQTILDVGNATTAAKSSLAKVLSNPNLGPLVIHSILANSTVAAVKAICEEVEATHPDFGGGWDICVLDYLGKMSGMDTRLMRHEQLGEIAQDLSNMVRKETKWVVTGSQIKADANDPPRPEDLSGSKLPGEVADVVINIYTPKDDPDSRMYSLAKVRGPGAGQIIGPIPHELDRARMSPFPII